MAAYRRATGQTVAVPRAPVICRASAVVLLGAGALAACSGIGPRHPSSPGAPSTAAVAMARYATVVDLDHGDLHVAPPPAGETSAVPETEAEAMFDAADAVQGPHAFSIFGLGIASVATEAQQTPTTTTVPPPPSTTAPTTAPSPPPNISTAPTTTAPPTTTTTVGAHPPAAPGPSARTPGAQASTVGPALASSAPVLVDTPPSTSLPSPSGTAPTSTVPVPVLPGYHHRLAWVGIVWGPTESCPGSTTTQPASTATTTYIAVLIDAHTGHQVLAYRSGGSSPCGGTPRIPAVTQPGELVSVAWQPVGPSSTAVQIQVPPCGRYYGWTQLPTTGTGIADQVVVDVPFDPSCGAATPQSQVVDQVVPLGPGQKQVGHAALGPIRALQALPTD